MRLPQTIASTINSIARTAMGKDWALYATLLNHWGEIVGEEYAKVTTPVKIVFPHGKKEGDKWASGNRTGGILTIALPHGLAMEFSFLTETMLARINGFFGYPAIEKIALQGRYDTALPAAALPAEIPALSSSQQAALRDKTKDIEDPELKSVLLDLGQSIETRNRAE
ncbi:MAG: DciA family protein [Bdellovibrionales bacterium]|jgi:hypothetical protein